jgi:glycosyltransferase involved in cell wall biosynthesis
MIKVLHLIGSLGRGGAEVLLSDLCNNSNGTIALQVVSTKGGSLERGIEDSNAGLKIIPSKGLHVRFILKLRRFLLENEIEIVHVHSGFFCIHALLAVLLTDIKIVVTLHNYRLNTQKMLKKITFAGADAVCFVSEFLMQSYLKSKEISASSVKYRVLHNGIDPNKFNVRQADLRQSLNLPGDCLLLGMVGNFNEVRDHFTLCKGIKLLINNGYNSHFVFAGAAHISKLFDQCYSFCKDNHLLPYVHFLGSRPDIPEILAALDLFVYASNLDTFGIAVVEAMMSGTPVVVNDLPVFQEVTGNGKYASLYKTKYETDLAEKIEYLLEHPEERKRLGEASRKWAIENFSIQKHIEQLQAMYQELLSKK